MKNKGNLAPKVHEVPAEIEQFVAREKLATMGIQIDSLSAEQTKYLSDWEQGT